MKTVTVFGSSLPNEGTAAYAEARRLGRLLAEAGFAVCNGGYSGIMEASARGAREAGGHTIGITCIVWQRPANSFIVDEVRTQSFPMRLMTLVERGDAYVVLPGGTGTLAELALCWEMMNKASLAKTVGGRKPLLVKTPYWQPVIDCLLQESELADGNAQWLASAMNIVTRINTPEQAVEHLSKEL
jgi:uncharacterized protein (TIGR00730 family)